MFSVLATLGSFFSSVTRTSTGLSRLAAYVQYTDKKISAHGRESPRESLGSPSYASKVVTCAKVNRVDDMKVNLKGKVDIQLHRKRQR